ncbi:hypothetical protein CHELA40_12616 [Chelatococcus asaccharovorans]|nr:hypothetical protein CHELA40_12616 [Chelatococcus asaccharovorans]CAH1682152.1 hypothetical protein CHELA17_62999 [Chelatococcus asaccharovorans]
MHSDGHQRGAIVFMDPGLPAAQGPGMTGRHTATVCGRARPTVPFIANSKKATRVVRRRHLHPPITGLGADVGTTRTSR